MSDDRPHGGVIAGVDYVRVTATSSEGLRNLEEVYRVRELQELIQGNLPTFTVRYGYEGFRTGPYYFGRRGESAMFEVSSDSAASVMTAIDWNNVRVTRIDLQVTAWSDHGEDWAQKQKDRVCAAIDANTGNAMAEPLLISPRKGKGDTLSLGSRSSPRYGRLYNKGLQSGDEYYHGSWRYEVEYKDAAAPLILQRLRSNNFAREYILRTVAGQFDYWHVERTFHSSSPIVPEPLGRKHTDLERKLEWLKTQVRGTVDKLRENGLELKALEVLGFIPGSTDSGE